MPMCDFGFLCWENNELRNVFYCERVNSQPIFAENLHFCNVSLCKFKAKERTKEKTKEKKDKRIGTFLNKKAKGQAHS